MCFLALMKKRLKIYKHQRFSKETHKHAIYSHCIRQLPPAIHSTAIDQPRLQQPRCYNVCLRGASKRFRVTLCAKYKPEDTRGQLKLPTSAVTPTGELTSKRPTVV